MKAVIIAGGKGTRLKDHAPELPKPMIPVAGKPVLEYQINLLVKYGITDIIILVNHLKDSIISYFEDGKKWGAQIQYFAEEKPLGTVGGLKEIEHLLKDDFLVLYGDVLLSLHLQKFIDFHYSKKSDCTLAVHPNDHPYDSDLLDIDLDGKVVAFHPKPHEKGIYLRNLVNAALYIFSPKVLSYLEKGKKADFGKDIFPHLYSKINMYGYNTTEYMKDMGTPDRLETTEKDILSGKFEARSYERSQKAIFLDRDGVLNEDSPDFIKTPEEFHLFPFTSEAVKQINQSDFLAIVVTNQSGIARNLYSEETLKRIHNKAETILGYDHAKLDAIYYCPHHPHKGFEGENPALKIECDCRKPKPGMLLQAAKDFNIDLSESYLIGDTFRDIEAGKKAGTQTIGVRTGNACKNMLHEPDFMFENVEQACRFITTNPYNKYIPQVFEKVLNSKSKPFILRIGGNSRSGKSTFSSYLKSELQKVGKSVFLIHSDVWIMPASQRTGREDLFKRFRIKEAQEDILKILDGEKMETKAYSALSRESRDSTTLEYKNEDIVIIEGIPSLWMEKLDARTQMNIYCEVPENIRKERLQQFYAWKGIGKNEFEILYAERQKDEYDFIEKSIDKSNLVVS